MDDKEKEYQKEAEDLIQSDSGALLKKINSIVFWSYSYFTFVLVFSVLLTVLFILSFPYLRVVGLWFAVITAGTAYAVYKGLFYSTKPVEGYLLSQAEYPELFNVIGELEQKLSVKIHKVYLDSSFNAGVTQRPKFGVFGGYENILIIGMDFLLFVSKEELVAVLAHELTHISNDDSRSTGGSVRIRNSWIQMIIALSNRKKWSAKPVMWFLNKTWPRLDAYTFAYARMGEYKADAFSAEYSGKQTWGEMIAKTTISSLYLKRFFEELHKKYKNEEEPPKDPIEQLIQYLSKPIQKKDLQEWITQMAFEYTRAHDTHPALEDRLNAQGFDISLESISNLISIKNQQTAAQAYLGKNYTKLVHYFNNKIFQDLSVDWKNFVEHQKFLDEIINSQENTSETEIPWTQFNARIQKDGLKSIENEIDAILLKNPKESTARYYKGTLLLEDNKEEGEKILLSLVDSKEVSYADVYQPLYEYYAKNNFREKGRELEKLIEKENSTMFSISNEINKSLLSDRLVEHDLSQDVIFNIQKCGAHSTGIASIHIAKKILKTDPTFKTYVAVVKEKWWHMYSQNKEVEIVQNILDCLPAGSVFIQRSNYRYSQKIKKVPSSKIYTSSMLLEVRQKEAEKL